VAASGVSVELLGMEEEELLSVGTSEDLLGAHTRCRIVLLSVCLNCVASLEVSWSKCPQ